MPPDTQNPLIIAAYVVGLLISLPAVALLVKGIFFVAKASAKIEQIDAIAEDVRQIRHDRRDDTFSVQLSLTVIEDDINRLQEKTGLPVRQFPDRRVGPADRRGP